MASSYRRALRASLPTLKARETVSVSAAVFRFGASLRAVSSAGIAPLVREGGGAEGGALAAPEGDVFAVAPSVNAASRRRATPANCPAGYLPRYSLKSSGSPLFLIASHSASSKAAGSTRAGGAGAAASGLAATAAAGGAAL